MENIFIKSEDHKWAIASFKETNIYNLKLSFRCYTDHTFTYGVHTEYLKHEVSFITDDVLLDKMTGEDLLHLKGVTFFEHVVWDKDSGDKITEANWVSDIHRKTELN